MMLRWVGWVLKALILPGCIGYQWLVHSAIVTAHTESIRLMLALPPLLAMAYWAVAKSRHKFLWVLVMLGLGIAVYVIEDREQLGLAAAYGIAHALIYLSLLWLFGRTVVIDGREPFITRLARQVHGTLPPMMKVFTRQITIAWCFFFAAQLITSALLLKFASLETWSLFINLLNLPLLLLMFIGEYTYRVIRFPAYSHASILRGIQAFAQDSPSSKGVEVS